MGKIYSNLPSIFLLLLMSISFYVSALPNGADTCDVEKMKTIGHGTTDLKGSAGYKLTSAMSAPGVFAFTFDGPEKTFEGILAYVVDSSGKRLGEFTDLPSTLKFKDGCGTPSSTVTHNAKNVKNFPFNLSWKAPQGTTGSLTVKSLLVIKGVNNWAQLDDVTFDSVTGAASAGAPPSNAGGAQDNTQSDGFLQKYSLFLIMIGITTLLYIVGSFTEAMLKRQQVKSRSFAKTINGFDNAR